MKTKVVLLSVIVAITTSCFEKKEPQVAEATYNISVDTSFGTSGFTRGHFSGAGDSLRSSVSKVLPLASGKLLVLTSTSSTSLGQYLTVSRWNADGSTLDTTFAAAETTPGIIEFDIATGSTMAGDMVLQSDGKILVSGGLSAVANTTSDEGFVLRLTADGILDGTFGATGIFRHSFGSADASISSLAVNSSDEITFTGFISNYQTLIGRLTASGTLDTTFDTDGWLSINFDSAPDYDVDNASGSFVFLTTTGKIVVVTDAWNTSLGENSVIVSQFNSDGSSDTSFSADGHVQIENNTHIVPMGAVLNSNDEVVILVDTTDATVNYANGALIRVTTAGALDTSFGTSGFTTLQAPSTVAAIYAGALAQTSAGRLIATGIVHSGTGGQGKLFAQVFDVNGSVMSSIDSGLRFEVDTATGFDEWVFSATLDANGKLLVTGEESPPGPTNQDGYITRLMIQ